jgi:hypothetical protein
MESSFEYDYARYLSAKKTVDQRAFDRRVWGTFTDHVNRSAERSTHPVRILEVGGGVGATIPRLIAACPGTSLDYTMVELEPGNVQAARQTLLTWADDNDVTLSESGDTTLRLSYQETTVDVDLIHGDMFEFLDRDVSSYYTAVIGQAIFDVVDLPYAVQLLTQHLEPGGMCYAPVHFDGMTAFEPTMDDRQGGSELDDRIVDLYHASMRRQDTDGARSGRDLLTAFRSNGVPIVAAGGSDWIVLGTPDDGYPADEAYFLQCILHFVEEELTGDADLSSDDLDTWLHTRRQQIADGKLIFVSHHLDVLAQRPGPA